MRTFFSFVVMFLALSLAGGCGKSDKPIPKAELEAGIATACANNLRQLDLAKIQWAQAFGKGSNDVPTMDDLAPMFRNGTPICPGGGTYTIGPVGEHAKCSIEAHNQFYKESFLQGQ